MDTNLKNMPVRLTRPLLEPMFYPVPNRPCPHIAQLLGLNGAGSTLEVLVEAARQVDIKHLLAEAADSVNIEYRLSNLLDLAPVNADPQHPSRIVFDAFERHVQANRFPADCNDEAFFDGLMVENCVVQLLMSGFTDFEHFEAMLERVARLCGRQTDAPKAIGGLEPAEYWSVVIASCEPTTLDGGETIEIGDSNPIFWSAIMRRALAVGMTPDTPVYRMGDWPKCDPKAGLEPFRDAIEARVGATSLAIFDALTVEHDLARVISTVARTVEPSAPPPRRARLV